LDLRNFLAAVWRFIGEQRGFHIDGGLAGLERDPHRPHRESAKSRPARATFDCSPSAGFRARPTTQAPRSRQSGLRPPSTLLVGDRHAETIIGLYKTELIRLGGPWKGIDDVEYATLELVDWFNHRRLLEPIGYVPPAEFEEDYWRKEAPEGIAGLREPSLRWTRGDSV
jgi:transposase InsO family protein